MAGTSAGLSLAPTLASSHVKPQGCQASPGAAQGSPAGVEDRQGAEGFSEGARPDPETSAGSGGRGREAGHVPSSGQSVKEFVNMVFFPNHHMRGISCELVADPEWKRESDGLAAEPGPCAQESPGQLLLNPDSHPEHRFRVGEESAKLTHSAPQAILTERRLERGRGYVTAAAICVQQLVM